jgi:hypothetical protein
MKSVISKNKKNFYSAVKKLFCSGWGLVLAVTVSLTGGIIPAAAATNGADDKPAYLALSESVDEKELQPGTTFTYGIKVTCSEEDCANATLKDALPSQFAGFTVVGLQMSPTSVGAVATWNVDGVEQSETPDLLTDDTTLSVAFTEDFGGQKGLGVGTTARVNLSLKVPLTLDPEGPLAGATVTNMATVESDNSRSAQSSAEIRITIPQTVDATIAKTWSPATASYAPGASSAVRLVAKNTSNVSISKLVVVDPQADATGSTREGAKSLATGNPFRFVDFAGFGEAALPTGATAVQVDAYVEQNGAWHWVEGAPSASFSLPSGVNASAVGGLRYAYTGKIAPGASAAATVKVEQRGRDRNGGSAADLSKNKYTATNNAQVRAEKAGVPPSAPRYSTASYRVTPRAISATVSKNIADSSLPAGESTTATIVATNTGEAVNKFTVEDPSGFFDGSLLIFDGFTYGISYPTVGEQKTGVKSAAVTYVIATADSERKVEVPFDDGALPALPQLAKDEYISSFTLTFMGEGDSIPQNATTAVEMKIGTSEDAMTANTEQKKNTASLCVTAANVNQACGKSSDNLTIVKPRVDISVRKTVTPSRNLRPGQSAVVALNPQISSATGNVKPTQLTVTDEQDSSNDKDFWNGFNLTSIEPTQIVAGSTLTILVKTAQSPYFAIGSKKATAGTTTLGFDSEGLTAALTSAKPGTTPKDVTGIQFVYGDADGFAASLQPQPQLVFTSRSTTRTDSSIPTDAVDNDAKGVPVNEQRQTVYTNKVAACGSSTHEGLQIPCSTAEASTGIIVYPTHSVSAHLTLNKEWSMDAIASRSSNHVLTTLKWTTGWGNSEITISDPADDAADTQATAFDAFNLTGIAPIAASNSLPSIKYDVVKAVELYYEGAWHAAARSSANTTWQSRDGSFIGYTLSAGEQQKATGVRIILGENTEARDAAADYLNPDGTPNKAFDATAPRSGEGVQAASGKAPRTFTLEWEPRATLRSAPHTYVSQNMKYNTEDKGVIENCAVIQAKPAGRESGCDTVNVYDNPPYVSIKKSTTVTNSLNDGADTSSILVPAAGTVEDSGYPTLKYTLTAMQRSLTPATHVRVTDPAPCSGENDVIEGSCTSEQTEAGATANPFAGYETLGTGNPFNRQNITGIDVHTATGVNLAASTVWLLHYNSSARTFTSTNLKASAANSMTKEALADVVGVSVTFQDSDVKGGTIPNGTKLMVDLSTQVRSTLRDSGAAFVPTGNEDSKNTAFAQSYNTTIPVVSEEPDKPPYDFDHSVVTFNSGVIDVKPDKDISDDSVIMEPADNKSKTVTLRANQGASTLSPRTVTMTDEPDGAGKAGDSAHSTDFWTNFNMTSLPKVTFPDGADHLRLSAYVNGTWKEGALQEKARDGSSYRLPDGVALADVAGLKVEFLKEGQSSNAAQTFQKWNVPGWNTKVEYTVELRSTQRGGSAPVKYVDGAKATNVLAVRSEGILDKSDTKTASDTVRWSPGEARLAIDKCAQYVSGTTCDRLVDAGTLVPWDITIKNTGTGYLDIDTVTDEPGEFLHYTGLGSGPADHPGYRFLPQEGTGGTLQAQPKLAASSNGGKLVFSWENGKNRLSPGETVKLRVWMELQPGITSTQKAVNDVTVTTKQKLASAPGDAVPGDGNNSVTAVGNNGAKTSDYVQPRGGENLYVIKGVRGALSGAINPAAKSMDCANSTYTGADGTTYYRSPCVANSNVGGTDQWSLHAVNAGTSEYESMTFFDQLPAVGDTMLVKGDNRGSQYRPQLKELPKVVGAPEGSSVRYEISKEKNACVGMWTSNPSEDYLPCGTSGWTTVDNTSSVDWSAVRGLRVTVDFTTSGAKSLKPGKSVDITYSTTNWPKTDSNVEGASVEVDEDNQYIWNQYGLLYRGKDSSGKTQSPRTIAPNKVGVRLAKGSVTVTKNVEGDAADSSPDSVTATMACVVRGSDGRNTTVTFGGEKSKLLKLLKQKDGTYKPVVVSGISYGASCEVKEDGAIGAFGETSREGDPTSVIVDNSDTTADDGTLVAHPTEASTVALVNVYKSTALVVKKTVDTTATGGKFGPFTFALACTTSDNRPVNVGLGASGEFTLAADAQRRFSGIPANSTCHLEETDAGGANSTAFLGNNVDQNSDTAATIQMVPSSDGDAEGPVKVEVVTVANRYDVGTLTIIKKRVGPGAKQRGAGPFEVLVACAIGHGDAEAALPLPNNGKVILSGSNGYRASIDNLLVGARCSVKETDAAGADLTSTDPASGVVVIDGADDNNVTITNYFKLLPPVPSIPPSVPSQLLPTPSAPSTQLPSTGVSIVWLVLGASVLLFAGILLSQRFSGTGMRRGSGKHKA